jgi:hypothetical protein
MQAAKQHADEVHQGEYSDADLRILVDTAAYDAGRESVSQ